MTPSFPQDLTCSGRGQITFGRDRPDHTFGVSGTRPFKQRDVRGASPANSLIVASKR